MLPELARLAPLRGPLLGALLCPPFVALAVGSRQAGVVPVTALPMRPSGTFGHATGARDSPGASDGAWHAAEAIASASSSGGAGSSSSGGGSDGGGSWSAQTWQSLRTMLRTAGLGVGAGAASASAPRVPLIVPLASVARAAEAEGAAAVVFAHAAGVLPRGLAHHAHHRKLSAEAAAAYAVAGDAPEAAWRAAVERSAARWAEHSTTLATAWVGWTPSQNFAREVEDVREAGGLAGLYAQRRAGQAAVQLVEDALRCIDSDHKC